jgi:pSer/pThr/pTyr-binding forkhead associated (FHA) protein
MLGSLEGEMADERTAVRRAIAGKRIGLPTNLDAALVVLEGDGKGKRMALTKHRILFGRKQADVVLSDPEASRQHCTLLLYGDFAVVKDMGSANGTKVNNRIVKEGLVKSGDTLQIGTTVFQFLLSSKIAQSAGPSRRNA